jgi:hypothetical protein
LPEQQHEILQKSRPICLITGLQAFFVKVNKMSNLKVFLGKKFQKGQLSGIPV